MPLDHESNTATTALTTEAEWHASSDLEAMLQFVEGKVSDRKLRLFACACCRHLWHKLNKANRRAIKVSEKFADGLATEKELSKASGTQFESNSLWEYKKPPVEWTEGRSDAWTKAAVGRITLHRRLHSTFGQPLLTAVRDTAECVSESCRWDEDATFQPCELLRCLVSVALFRSIGSDPAWLNAEIVALAQAIYDDSDFERLPALAEELEREGCSDNNILTHCRRGEPHARGCWVLDLVLLKS